MRILVVEDEDKLSDILVRGLKAEGFAVDAASDGVCALELAVVYPYDAIILDIILPGMNGTQLLKRIRERDRETPILMLTAQDSVQDKVLHFETGADDYLTKPFSFAELSVRLKALLRRAPAQRDDVIRIDDLEIHRLTRKVKRCGQKIELGTKEYALLEYLVLNAGRIMSRTMIIEHVWDQSFDSLTNIVDVYVRQLRIKIDDGHDTKLIQTIRGSGYMIREGAAS